MKLISFPTTDFDGLDYDLTIFFQLTDEEYNRLINTEFADIWEMYAHCEVVSVGMWNTTLFQQIDDVTLEGSVYNHTNDIFITPELTYGR
jgi:hypothetical protein